MNAEDPPFVLLLRELMRRRKRSASQLAAELGVNHASVSRWLSGKHVPDITSCRKLAEYMDVPVVRILSIVGHLPSTAETRYSELPTFREYVHQRYPTELDDDVISMIEDLIERRRGRANEREEA